MLSRLRLFADALFRRGRFEKSMADEMRFHMDAYADDLMRSGVAADEARRRARLEFGGVETVREECRQARGLRLLDELRQDLIYARRQMARSPLVTAAALVSLALGIGANTAIFSVMDAALFRTLPVQNPHELYYLGHTSGSRVSTSANYPLLERYRNAGVFAAVTAYEGESFVVKSAEGVERVNGQFVSGNYHAVLGVPMTLGRGFSTERDRDAGENPIAVISDGYWSREFARDPQIVGRALNVRGREVTIVGVTAPGFRGLTPGSTVDLTLPMSMMALDEPEFFDARDGWVSLSLVGRLKTGVSEAETLAVVAPLFTRFWMEPANEWARRGPNPEARWGVMAPASRGSGELRGRYGVALWILMGMVATVLLIACVNVANLLMTRATARATEVSVRLSIGAGRARLIRQFLTESYLLAAAGGLLGLLMAHWTSSALLSFFDNGPYPVLLDVPLNAKALGFTAGVSMLTGLAFGLHPAWRATGVALSPALQRRGGSAARPARWPVGRALVAAQIALCMLLLTACGLLVQSVRNLKAVDAGFTRENVLLFDVELGEALGTTEGRLRYYDELLERLRALPGVQSVALAKRSPLDSSSELRRIEVPGFDAPSGLPGVSANTVTPEYFRTLDIDLIRGRGLAEQDRDGSEKVVVVGESMARDWFGSAEALGRTILLGGNRDAMTIVGIVRDTRHEGIRADVPRSVYTPLAQPTESFDGSVGVPDELTAMVKVDGNPSLLAPSVVDHVRTLEGGAVFSWVRTMQQQVDVALLRERLLARLSTAFGLLAFLLAATGLYGVVSYDVTRRTHEIGICMALGATRQMVIRHVLRDVLFMSVIAIVIGTGLTLATARALSAFLFGLSSSDPQTLAFVGTSLLGTILVAGYVAAWRATTRDPMRALKSP